MKNPIILMSAITGKPTKERIFEYMKGLKDNGIESIMLYPRSGCEIEYLSEEWFVTVGYYIFAAKSLNMDIWLYDDFNWPSGDAGGRVTKIEKYRLKAIKTKGENVGEKTCKSQHNSGIFGEKFFPDLLSEEAVDYFIKCTHEEYLKRFGEYFGTVIKGMFTDEPSIGYCCEDGFIPYYDGIEKDYNDFCHRDFNKDMEDEYEDFYFNATEVVSNRFNKCYLNKISSWCKKQDILMTGHMMCDDSPDGATKHSGHFLKNLSSFSLPGIDEISSDFSSENEMALFGACEYANKGRGAMAELFALGPCDMPYGKKKCMLYLASAFKIDRYFLAISHLDMRGNLLVIDYFNNFNTDQPDFGGMKLLAKEGEICAKLAKRDFIPDFYIRYPFKQCAKRKNQYGNALNRLVNELTYKGIQWKFIDDEKIENKPVIEISQDLKYILNGREIDLFSIKEKYVIENSFGERVKGIFIREFENGSILILNLFAPSGEYKINGHSVFLEEYGVKFSLDELTVKKEEVSSAFKVNYCNDNIIRAMYLNGQKNAEICLNCDTELTFFVRNGVNAKINGELIQLGEKAEILSSGMKDLYEMSPRIAFEKGKYTVESEKDFKYLPSVLVCGDFSCEVENGEICKVTLSNRKEEYVLGEKLYGFGKIEFTSKVSIPNYATKLEIQGTEMYTLVYLDDILLDEKIASPYEFKITEEMGGKNAELKIVQYSSIAPIFGDVDYWDKNTEKSGWRGTPSTKNIGFGFEKLYWVVK